MPANAWNYYTESDQRFLVFASGHSGQNTSVFRANINQYDPGTTVTADVDGIPINTALVSREHLMFAPEEADLEYVFCASTAPQLADVFHAIDAEDFGRKRMLGQLQKRFQTFDADGRGNSVQLKIANALKQESKFHGYLIVYEPRQVVTREQTRS